MFRHWRSLIAAAALFAGVQVYASEGHDHDHGQVDLGKLGKVAFDTSCSAAVKDEFSRAVAMMHSFWYVEAEKAFNRIAQADPQCAMAQWGIAMSNYHPLWAPPNAAELQRGRDAAGKAAALGGATQRERDYIAAVNAFYADAATTPHMSRATAYAKAMSDVAAKYASDREASIFYALSLLGTAVASDKTYAKQKEAAGILSRILPMEPEHPGVAHYIIHSYDYPPLAPMALAAARAYAKIAPGSPHALHMPSHIFTRLGLWEESIASNTASAEKAHSYISQLKPGAAAFDELHAIDYLVYAHLQRGDIAAAKALVDKAAQVDARNVDNLNFAAAYSLSSVPARFALERREWAEAARLPVTQNVDWKAYPYAESNTHFARAIGAARSGDLNTAKAAIDRLAEIRGVLQAAKDSYWTEQLDIQRVAGLAWLAHAAGLKEEAQRLMRSAADREDLTEKHPVTPGPVIPARELLADMLLEDGDSAGALTEIKRALEVSPGRRNAMMISEKAGKASTQVVTR
jgi:hypothetical protein